MSVAIVSQNLPAAKNLSQVLLHYFPSDQLGNPNKLELTIKTKYYTSNVPINCLNTSLEPYFPESIPSQHNQQPDQISEQQKIQKSKSMMKTDCLVFVFEELEPICVEDNGEEIVQLIDNAINQLKPESFIICVNTPKKEDVEGKWIYEESVKNCENFIMVVYCNLQQLIGLKPQWNQALLMNEQQDICGLFQILELMHTTAWTNASKQSSSHLEPGKVEEVPEKQNIQKHELNEADEQEKLQKQMMEFQSLMRQLMDIKSGSSSDNQRKMRAEEFVMKLAKNMEI